MVEGQEGGLRVIIVVIVIVTVGTAAGITAAAAAAASGVLGLEAWRAADDAAFDGAVGGG